MTADVRWKTVESMVAHAPRQMGSVLFEWQARLLLAAGRVEAAWRRLMVALELDPENVTIYADGAAAAGARRGFWLGPGAQPDAQELLARLEACQARTPDCAPAWAWSGGIRSRWLDSFGATRDLERAIFLGLREPVVLAWLGATRFHAGDSAGGRRHFDEAVARGGAAWILAWYGRCELAKARDPVGFAYLDRAIAQRADFGWWYAWRGEAHRQYGRLDMAMADYEAALERPHGMDAGRRAVVFAWQGRAKLDAGEPGEALAWFGRSIAADRDHLPARTGRAAAFRALGRTREWLSDLDAASRMSSTVLDRWVGSQVQGTTRDALAELDAECGSGEPWPLGLAWRGFFRLRLGQPEAALPDLDAAVRLAPDAQSRLWRAEARLALGNNQEALDDLNAFVTAEPSRIDGRIARSRARALLGRFQEAERDLDHALRLDPGDARTWAERGALRLRTGRMAEAKEDLDRALALDSHMLNAIVDLSVLEQATGHPEQASKTFARALQESDSAPRDRLCVWNGLHPLPAAAAHAPRSD